MTRTHEKIRCQYPGGRRELHRVDVRRGRRLHLVKGIALPARPWHSHSMPDYSLFGDEHVRQYETTGGKVGHDWNGAHCLILHTTARKSGQTRKFPLIYGRDGDDYVIVASKGGAPEHPGWYQNLVAHPDVKIQVRDKVLPVRARTEI